MPKPIASISPKAFNVWPDRGLLPNPDPLDKLPKAYGAINDLAKDLPLLLRTKQLRRELDKFPVINLSRLRGRQVPCAMRSYSFFASAYVYAVYEETAKHLPEGVAIPLHYLATRLSRKPILSYDSYAPQNWRRIDPNGLIALGNIEVIQNFLGGRDEDGFILVHVEIEANASPALRNGLNAQKLAIKKDAIDLYLALKEISYGLQRMHASLMRMSELCDPYIYYNTVRPYIHGFKGVIYRGVKEYNGEPQSFLGETGAQSGIVPCLDAVLGIEHAADPLSMYLSEMRKYMPEKHRAFIAKLEENKQAVRDYVLGHREYTFCRDAYNECVEWLWKFRKQHLEYADIYINKQSQTSSANPTTRGTGGTPYMEYLSKHVDETLNHIIS